MSSVSLKCHSWVDFGRGGVYVTFPGLNLRYRLNYNDFWFKEVNPRRFIGKIQTLRKIDMG